MEILNDFAYTAAERITLPVFIRLLFCKILANHPECSCGSPTIRSSIRPELLQLHLGEGVFIVI